MGLLVLECHVLPLPKLFLATLPGLGLLLNASSCARRTVSSYKPKHPESEVEKGFCRPMQEMRGLCPPSLKICAGFQQSSFHLSSCLFLVALDLRCCLWALSTVATRGDYPRVAVRRLLVVVASLVARHRLHAWDIDTLKGCILHPFIYSTNLFFLYVPGVMPVSVLKTL